jgi:hypothetical protein
MLRKSMIAILIGTAGLALPSVAPAHTDVQVSHGYNQPYHGYDEPRYSYEQSYYPPVYAYQQHDDDEGYYGADRGEQSDRQAYYQAREENSRRHVWAWQHRHDGDR